MGWPSNRFPVFLFAVVMGASPQSPKADPAAVREQQKQATWLDRSTGLVWARKDNGQDVNWRKATGFCRDLRLDGYSDWRLPTIDELEGIYDAAASAPGLSGQRGDQSFTFHVRGNIFLTGNPWSSTQRRDDRGHLIGFAWFFDFHNVRNSRDPTDHHTSKRALCVRGAER